MSPHPQTEYDDLSREGASRVDATCDGFEKAWKATRAGGPAPRIADYLDGYGDPERPVLARELIALDRACRERYGVPPAPPDTPAGPPALGACPVESWPRLPGLELVEVVGAGGMGVVFKARQPALGRDVAVKLLRAASLEDAGVRARFLQEARSVARLQHPHLVQIFEFGELPGAGGATSQPYLVMEYVSGGSLADLLRGAPRPPKEAARLVETLADAIHFAHQQGIIHRDLKPANILLSFSLGSPKPAAGTSARPSEPRPYEYDPKITDFGLAKWLTGEGAGPTRSGDFLGTPSYMAPEQVEGPRARIGPAADIYGLGAILYEMLTGRPPFLGETALATLLHARANEPVPPSRLQPGCPRDVETIVLKCLSKDPARRYASAAALAKDLRHFREGLPIAARPARWPEHLAKWARRRPAVAGLLTALAAVTLLGLVGILWQGRRADRERDEAIRLGAREAAARADAEAQLYASQIAQAYLDWAASRTLAAERILDTCWKRNPQRCGWEWHYLKRQCQTHVFALAGHTQPINSIAYSPDGKWLASGAGHWNATEPGEVKLWNPQAGKPAHNLTGPKATVHRVAFHPRDGSLAAACMDGTVYRWDLRRPDRPLPLPPLKYGSAVYALAFHRDGRSLATCDANGTVEVRDLETLKTRGSWRENTSNAFDVAFSPDGKYLASASREGTVIVLATDTYRPKYRCHHRSDARRVAFSPDSRILASASYDGAVILWDLGEQCKPLLTHHLGAGNVQNLAFSPDSLHLACCTRSTGVRIWNVRGQREEWPLGPATGTTYSFAYSPDSCWMATAKDDQVIRVWSLLADEEPRSMVGHDTWITGLALSPDGKTLALAGGWNWTFGYGNKTVRLVDFPSGTPHADELVGHTSWPTGVAFRPDGRQLASGDEGGLILLWDPTTRRPEATLKGHKGAVLALAYSPDATTLATASADHSVRLWDASSGKQRGELRHPAGVHALAHSSDGRYLATGGADRVVRVWDAATGRELRELRGHEARVTSAAFCPDSHLLATADEDHELRFWDADTGEDLTVHEGTFATASPARQQEEGRAAPPSQMLGTCLGFSPDGSRLVFAAAARPVQLWDVASRRPIVALGQPDPVYNVNAAFSGDGRQLLTTYRGAVKVWDSTLVGAHARAESARRRAPAWHQKQAALDFGYREWFSSAFHATRILEADSKQSLWYARRGVAWAALGDAQLAAADHARAVTLTSHQGDIRQWPFPGNADVWTMRGEALVRLKQWREADGAFNAAVQRDPGNVRRWYNLATARLGRGNAAGYRATCRELLRRFGTSQGGVAAMVVYAAAPLAKGDDPDVLLRLGTRAAQASPANQRVLGAASYRAGRHRDALGCFANAMHRFRPRAWDMLFRAMAHQQVGEATESRALLARGRSWVAEADRVEANPTAWSDEVRWYHWNERVEVHALLAEAKAVIGEDNP